MSSLLLALLHQGGFALLDNPLLGTFKANQVSPELQAHLAITFRHLLMASAGVGVIALVVAVLLPDRPLRGH